MTSCNSLWLTIYKKRDVLIPFLYFLNHAYNVYHVLPLMNKFITLLLSIIIRDHLAGFDWLLSIKTAVAATHRVGSGEESTSQ